MISVENNICFIVIVAKTGERKLTMLLLHDLNSWKANSYLK